MSAYVLSSVLGRLPWLAALVLSAGLLACNADGGASPMGNASGNPADALRDYYAPPPLAVQQLLLNEGDFGNPLEIRVFMPEGDGKYPLLQFQHGFVSDVDTYTELLSRLAGFGFIVVAPQMYGSNPTNAPSVAQETAAAVDVLTWVQTNLADVLAAELDHPPVFSAADTGVFGHSRGGQIAWRMLFDHPQTQARALAGVDPVDGDAPPFPPGGTGDLVTDDDGAFGFAFPSLILGMGLGAMGAPGFECAPEVRNYRHFYEASSAPRYQVVALDYGHSDMLNGNTPNLLCFGALDGSNEQLRIFIAGQLAAYFSSVLGGRSDFVWLTDVSNAPVAVQVEFDNGD